MSVSGVSGRSHYNKQCVNKSKGYFHLYTHKFTKQVVLFIDVDPMS